MESTNCLQWPSSLLFVLQKHQKCVGDLEDARVPPSNDKTYTISDFFQDNYNYLLDQMTLKGVPAEVSTCCVSLLYEMIEQSSLLSLLSAKERKYFQSSSHFDKKANILAKAKASKRRRTEDANALSEYKFSRILPVEYLLRFLFALPHVIDHYKKLSGPEIPSYADQHLWLFANLVLEKLSAQMKLFVSPEAYVALR